MEPLVEFIWFLKELYIHPERCCSNARVDTSSQYVGFLASMMSFLLVFTIQNECEGLSFCVQISAGFFQRSLAFLIVIAPSPGPELWTGLTR